MTAAGVLWAGLALLTAAPAPTEGGAMHSDLRRARDGNIAIQEELDAARKAATIEAYDLFIARHPDHPLARIACEERQRLLDPKNARRT
jgi:hypothetical protein